MEKVQVFEYRKAPISFELGNGQVMVNATEMAAPFGNSKRPQFWLNNQYAKEFLAALSEARNLASADLVQVTKGGNRAQGTWMHEDVALEFARWLSPAFAIWCNDRIKELLRDGATVLPATDDPHFVLQLLDRVRDGYEQSLYLRQENHQLVEELEAQAHKVAFYDNVQRCRCEGEDKRIYRISQIAAELGMKAPELNLFLERHGIQRKCGKAWTLTPEYQERGLTRKKTFQNGFDEDGEPTYCVFMVWTTKGREFILQLMEK